MSYKLEIWDCWEGYAGNSLECRWKWKASWKQSQVGHQHLMPQITIPSSTCSCVSLWTLFITKAPCLLWVTSREESLRSTLSWAKGQPCHPGVRKILIGSLGEGPFAPLGSCILSLPTYERFVILCEQRVSIEVRFCTPCSAHFLKSLISEGFP